MNEVIPADHPANLPAVQQAQQPAFQRSVSLAAGANAGSVAIEQERAIAEAQGQLILAKKFPRDENKSYEDLMRACKIQAFAGVAFYSKPRAGGAVSGPSIRLAEEIARAYGNFQYGHRELSRDGNKSEVEVYAWDMEKNNRSIRQITVFHVRDTKEGPKPLRDQSDIDDKIANVASKQVRGRILALMPKWLVEEAVQACKKTLAGLNDEPIEQRVLRMQTAFSKFGVTTELLERHLGHKLSTITVDELVELTGVHNALKDGGSVQEYFGEAQAAQQAAGSAATISATVEANKAAAQAGTTGQAQAEQKPTQARPTRQTRTAQPAAQQPAATQQAPAQQDSSPVQQESNSAEETTAAVSENVQTAEPVMSPESEAPPVASTQDPNDLF